MACPTGQIEQFNPITLTPVCVAAPKAETTGGGGLPPWVLDIIKNADKIGAGIGAATGKYQAPTPTGDVYVPPPTPPPADNSKFIWIGVGVVVLIVVVAVIMRGRRPV